MAAAISMTFPNAWFKGCQMSLEIKANKIEHLASVLFPNVHLETTAGLRYVCLTGISRVLPNPNLTLRGCPHKIIRSVFGADTADGLAASPEFQEEVRQGHDYTDCVSMVVSQRAEDGAFLFISLGVREGVYIRGKLYGY